MARALLASATRLGPWYRYWWLLLVLALAINAWLDWGDWASLVGAQAAVLVAFALGWWIAK